MTQSQLRYTGLTSAQVEQSRTQYGSNILTPPKRRSLFLQLLDKFRDPLIIILLIAGVLSIGISCYEYWGLGKSAETFFEPVGIFVAIFLATVIGFVFEMKADKEFAVLNQVNDDEPVEVIRNGTATSIPKKDVVVGDLVILNTGQEIPADGDLLEAVCLNVDESTLTGEPICHKSADVSDMDPAATYPTNHVLRGTKVMEGHGVFQVTAVGDRTENGKVFVAAQIDNSVRTPLDEQLDGLSALISKASYTVAGCVIVAKLIFYFHWAPAAFSLIIPTALFFWMVICKFNKWHWHHIMASIVGYFVVLLVMLFGLHHLLMSQVEIAELITYTLETLMIAVTLIVVAVPEGLPMTVTLSLAYSMRRMLKSNNLVRKMHACETMGATTVICTDKTGTLTQNQMQVHETCFYGLEEQQLTDDDLSKIIVEGMAVNATASLDYTDASHPTVLGNPTEGALLLWLERQGQKYQQLRSAAHVEQEIPFSTERKYMATLVASGQIPGKRVLYVKGAPEIVYSLCQTMPEGVRQSE